MTELADWTAKWADEVWRKGMAPERQLTVSEWADKYRQLPATSAEPGRWRTERVPYLAEIMDCLSTASSVERVVFMAGAQIGKTEAGLNWIGYVIDHAPGMMLLVMPSLDMLKRNSRTRIDPLIAATPTLSKKVAAPKAREKGNSIALKSFIGGELVMTGANAPTGLRSTPVRYIFLDEVDGYPVDASGEGDPVELAIRRTATYKGRRKIYLCSTPTLAGISRIEKAYLESDQRKFFVPCPECGGYQTIAWSRIKWPDDSPEEAFLQCEHCGHHISESQKPKMLKQGEWRATKSASDGKTAGFWLPGLYSPFETWGEMAREFVTVKSDPPRLQTFINTRLGEPYEDRDLAPIEAKRLLSRSEPIGSMLPDGVAIITAGIDTQDDRLELEIVGWGKDEESWSLAYHVLWGDPAEPKVWNELDKILEKKWLHPRAVPDLTISAAAIDSGGHRTPNVMEFCRVRQNKRVWAIKGRGGPGVSSWPKRPPKPKRGTAPLFIVGVDSIKHTLLSRLRIEEAGPGYCHFPQGRDLEYFRGITSEKPVKVYRRGVAKIKWVHNSSVRNEPLDCRVYAVSALHGLAAAGIQLNMVATALEEKPMRAASSVSQVEVERPRTIRSKWMS